MSLKLFYKLFAALIAVYALVVLVWPAALWVLIDDVSAQVNATNILISFFVLVVWTLIVIRGQLRARPRLADWPRPEPLWIGWVWLALCVAYTAFEHGWFSFPEFVYEEDGLFESATALAMLFCAVVFLIIGVRHRAKQNRTQKSVLFVLALVCLLLLLEEISWGQRIFGWSTPERLENINVQQETNLHNIFVGYNRLIRLVLSLLIASALIYREAWLRGLDRLGLGALMPPAAAIYFVPFLIYAHIYDELYEEVVAVFLVVYAVNLYRRLAPEKNARA